MATAKIPPVLRASTGGEKEVQVEGGNVGEALRGWPSSTPTPRVSCSARTAR